MLSSVAFWHLLSRATPCLVAAPQVTLQLPRLSRQAPRHSPKPARTCLFQTCVSQMSQLHSGYRSCYVHTLYSSLCNSGQFYWPIPPQRLDTTNRDSNQARDFVIKILLRRQEEDTAFIVLENINQNERNGEGVCSSWCFRPCSPRNSAIAFRVLSMFYLLYSLP